MPFFHQVTFEEVGIIGTVFESLARVLNTKGASEASSSGSPRALDHHPMLDVSIGVRKAELVVLGDTALRCREIAHAPIFKISMEYLECSASVASAESTTMRLAFRLAAHARNGSKKVWEMIFPPWYAAFDVAALPNGRIDARLIARDKICIKVTDTFVKCCGAAMRAWELARASSGKAIAGGSAVVGGRSSNRADVYDSEGVFLISFPTIRTSMCAQREVRWTPGRLSSTGALPAFELSMA